MDPNAALTQLRQLLAEDEPSDDVVSAWVEAARIFEGLDEWIQSGGFLPDEWRRDEPIREDQHGPIPTHGTGPEAIPSDHPDAPHVPWEEQDRMDVDDELEVTVTVSAGTAHDLLAWRKELGGAVVGAVPSLLAQQLAEAIADAADNMAENGREVSMPPVLWDGLSRLWKRQRDTTTDADRIQRVRRVIDNVADQPLPSDYPDADVVNASLRGRLRLADEITAALR